MRDKRADRQRDQGIRHAREQKGWEQSVGGLPDLSKGLRDENCATVDLHGKKSGELTGPVMGAISSARVRGIDTIRIVHGFNSGNVLTQELQRILFQLKKGGQVPSYQINPANPGETIVRLT